MADFDKVIPPGQEGKITAKINTKHYKGVVKKYITLTTNDKANKTVRLELSGTIKVLVDILPRDNVYFSTEKGNSQTKIVTLVNHSPKKLEILKLDNPMKEVKVSYEPFSSKRWDELMKLEWGDRKPMNEQKPAKADYLVVLTLNPETEVGQINGSVKLETNLGKKGQIELRVRGRVTGPISVTPTFMSLGKISEKLDEPIVRDFILRHAKQKPFKITEITSSEPFFKFKYDLKPDKSYSLSVSYEGGFGKGRRHGNITVKTDDPDQPEIKLRYSGWVVSPEELAKSQEQPGIPQDRSQRDTGSGQ